MAHEAREEQEGVVIRELPTATDEKFVVEVTDETDTTESATTEETVNTEKEV